MAFKEAPAKSDAEVLEDYELVLTGFPPLAYATVNTWFTEIVGSNPDWSARQVITKHVRKFGLSRFGNLVRILSLNPDLTQPVFVREVLIDLYQKCVDSAAVRGLLKAAGVTDSNVVSWVVESGAVGSEDRNNAIVRAVASTAVRAQNGGTWDAPIFALDFLGESELANRVFTALADDDPSITGPLPVQSITCNARAAVVVRNGEVADLQYSVDRGVQHKLSLDAIYLAAGLSRHDEWELVFHHRVNLVQFSASRGRVKATGKGITVTWFPAGRASRQIVFGRRVYTSEGLEKTPTARRATAAILASMFSTVESLTKTQFSIDSGILQNHRIDPDSMSALYRFQGTAWWDGQSRLAEPPQPRSDSSSSHSKHDVRGHWRYYSSGTIAWVRPHTRGH